MSANPSEYTKDSNIPVKSWRSRQFLEEGVGKKLMKESLYRDYGRYQIVFAFRFCVAATCAACALTMLLTSFTYPLGRQNLGSIPEMTKETGPDTDPDKRKCVNSSNEHEGGWGGRVAQKGPTRLLNRSSMSISKDDKDRSLYVFLPILALFHLPPL
jgi:hypothetical protein